MNDAFFTDVTLRDGLQSESKVISTELKLELADNLIALGSNRIEITSFVSPTWIPQFFDSDSFCRQFFEKDRSVETMAFVPNLKGAERAIQFPLPWLSTIVAVTEAFNQKNTNRSLDETAFELETLVEFVKKKGRKIRLYISTVFGCPYQGKVSEEALERAFALAKRLSPDEIVLSDTIGVATPLLIEEVMKVAIRFFPVSQIALHLHDTYGMALANCEMGWQLGVRMFDGSTGGIGGCPYAKGASGNVALEELQYMLFRSGRAAKLKVPSLVACLARLRSAGIEPRSRVATILNNGGALYGC